MKNNFAPTFRSGMQQSNKMALAIKDIYNPALFTVSHGVMITLLFQ